MAAWSPVPARPASRPRLPGCALINSFVHVSPPHPPPHFLSAVAYVTGIVLLVVVACFLIAVAVFLRRKDILHRRARAEAERAEEAARAQALVAEAAHRAANPLILPVVIVMPDGEMSLAEECPAAKGGGAEDEGADPEAAAAWAAPLKGAAAAAGS